MASQAWCSGKIKIRGMHVVVEIRERVCRDGGDHLDHGLISVSRILERFQLFVRDEPSGFHDRSGEIDQSLMFSVACIPSSCFQ